MAIFDVVITWIHVLSVVVFLGTMFVGTFVLLPTLKAHLDQENRQRFIVNFIPRVRSIVRVFVVLLVLTGISRALLLHFTHEGNAGVERLTVFGFKILFAFVPIAIFVLAPRILGRHSEEGLCCDPDANEPPAYILGVTTSTGAVLHYIAIAGGWLAVLFAIILTHMR